MVDSMEVDSEAIPPRSNLCRSWILLMVSLALSALFAGSFAVQLNDTSRSANWAAFYLLHAIVALSVIPRILCSFWKLRKMFLYLVVILVIWSITLIGISAKKTADTERGGSKEGGDSSNYTDKQEVSFELGGATIGLIASLYHLFLYGKLFSES